MRILVLQLARFGDIYLTWPVLRALKRQHPQAELHLVVRERFQFAAVGLEDVLDGLHVLPTRAILAPVLAHGEPDTEKSLSVLEGWLKTLPAMDRVINLSFSAMSSHLTRAVSHERTLIAGYSRHDDGTFCSEGPTASYYLAQVGVGGDNTHHLLELFAMSAGVELDPRDFRVPLIPASEGARALQCGKKMIAIQPYASLDDKSLDDAQWLAVAQGLIEKTDAQLLFLGSAADARRLDTWIGQLPPARVCHAAGRTELSDLFALLKKSALLLAPDSVTLHMAGLAQVPVVNLTFSSVNAFETGPWGANARIVFADEPEILQPGRVVAEVIAALNGEPLVYTETLPPYSQRLISAIYERTPFPMTTEPTMHAAYLRLQETMELALEQCHVVQREPKARTALLILGQIDDLVNAVVALAPDLEPLQRWLQAEMTRIGPGSFTTILTRTQDLYQQLLNLARLGLMQPQGKGAENAEPQLDLA